MRKRIENGVDDHHHHHHWPSPPSVAVKHANAVKRKNITRWHASWSILPETQTGKRSSSTFAAPFGPFARVRPTITTRRLFVCSFRDSDRGRENETVFQTPQQHQEALFYLASFNTSSLRKDLIIKRHYQCQRATSATSSSSSNRGARIVPQAKRTTTTYDKWPLGTTTIAAVKKERICRQIRKKTERRKRWAGHFSASNSQYRMSFFSNVVLLGPIGPKRGGGERRRWH